MATAPDAGTEEAVGVAGVAVATAVVAVVAVAVAVALAALLLLSGVFLESGSKRAPP